MKYTNRLEGLIDVIKDIERFIENDRSQILYHKENLIDENGEVVKYHADAIEKYESAIAIHELALDFVKELDIRRIHEFEESDANKPILYEVEE